MRRANDGLKITAAVEDCTNCGELKLRHRACGACGFYRGRSVIDVATASE
jgi:large subunit ribosomal protein L32